MTSLGETYCEIGDNMKKHPVFNPINVPLVINQNGDKLLTNKDRLECIQKHFKDYI